MNAMLSTTNPLPLVLNQAVIAGPGRRNRIENYCITSAALERFNELLHRLGRRQPPLKCDQLVTAARELCDSSSVEIEPASIGERMRKLETAARMVADPDWEAANEAAHTARLVVDYARGNDDLIPDWVPTVGRLDDAIVLDTAWPQLDREIASYLDFCRTRDVDEVQGAGLAGAVERCEWKQLCRDAAALVAHQRLVREHSYLPQPAGRFQIH